VRAEGHLFQRLGKEITQILFAQPALELVTGFLPGLFGRTGLGLVFLQTQQLVKRRRWVILGFGIGLRKGRPGR
jgi:hypothetical protein